MSIEKIKKTLNDNLKIDRIEITDQSNQHIGHSGWKKGITTHISLLLVSDDFKGKSKVQRHRTVYGVLQNELKEYIHALSIKALTIKEYDTIIK